MKRTILLSLKAIAIIGLLSACAPMGAKGGCPCKDCPKKCACAEKKCCADKKCGAEKGTCGEAAEKKCGGDKKCGAK